MKLKDRIGGKNKSLTGPCSLVAHVVDTRNYYTHFDSTLKNKILESTEIYYTTQFLKIVLKVILLKELGIDPELIKHRISNDQEW